MSARDTAIGRAEPAPAAGRRSDRARTAARPGPDGLCRLAPSCPWLADVDLTDYKVRILTRGTGAVTRVLVETSDQAGTWTTVGVHGNVVEASWLALVDALAYAALRDRAALTAAG
jgi:hypothetical protein